MITLRFSAASMLFAAFVFAIMFQETPAQKRPKKSKPLVVQVKPVSPDIAFEVSMPKPWTHLLEVEMRVRSTKMPDKLELKMPVWTPGSYLIREYARHVQDFTAASPAKAPLAWQKINKNTWQIETAGSGEIVAKYKVYANELTVRTNEVNDEHAFWNNAALLMFVKDHLAAPATLKINPYANWKIATGLPKVAGAENTFRAENFDVLYDSPFEVSNFEEISFDFNGKPHRIVFSGEGNYDKKRCADDIKKIVDETYKIFGEIPYDDYTFIVNMRGGGGLEHLNSTALQTNRFGFKPDSRYKSFLSLVAHEFFHAYNVKRIKPDALGPFDYENENYTKLLWVAEGATEYFSNLLLLRAGLINEREYLAARADGISQLQNRPGRFEMSLEESSFDAWIKYYRPDENAVNTQVSYYDKGEIVTMLLDIVIRTSSNGTKSLDDVMRQLYSEFYKNNVTGKNFSGENYQRLCEAAAGKSLEDFFTKYVRGTEELDYQSIFSGIGLSFKSTAQKSKRSYIGADTTEDSGRLVIRSINAGSPAYDQGLNTGDQIVAVDGYRASSTFFQSYIGERKPGDKIRLTIFRFDRLRDVEFTLGADNRDSFSIEVDENLTEQQAAMLTAYLNLKR